MQIQRMLDGACRRCFIVGNIFIRTFLQSETRIWTAMQNRRSPRLKQYNDPTPQHQQSEQMQSQQYPNDLLEFVYLQLFYKLVSLQMSTYVTATVDVSTTRPPEKSNDLLCIVIRAVSAFMQGKVICVFSGWLLLDFIHTQHTRSIHDLTLSGVISYNTRSDLAFVEGTISANII